MKKENIIEALRRFINQRSGIEFQNYQCGDWQQSRKCFLGDYRPIIKHGQHARAMLAVVALADSITSEHLLEASRAYSGRLQFQERDGKVEVQYTTGQYFPTEYRNAACAVLAQALWDYWLANLPKPDGKVKRTRGKGVFAIESEHDSYSGLTAGEWIRKKARQQFGRAIASTWFN